MAATLLGAIHARFRDSAPLSTLAPGGLHTGRVPAKKKLVTPYGVLNEIGEAPSVNTSGLTMETSRYQVSFFGPDPDALKAILPAWRSVFKVHMTPLAIDDRTFVDYLPGGCHLEEESGEGPVGGDSPSTPIYQQVIEFQIRTSRTDS